MPAEDDDDHVRLDPVLVEALKQLRSFTYRRRQLRSTAPVMLGLPGQAPRVRDVVRAVANLRLEDRARSLDDPGACSGAIHIFKHLKHHGYSWNPADIRAWAAANGFTTLDATKLAEYAQGIQAGTRYHTAPDPFGMHAFGHWQEDDAEGN